jgi:hypothetical protein
VGARSILFGGLDVTARPVQGRGMSMIFQTFALYPHLTVRANLAYPLREQEKWVYQMEIPGAAEVEFSAAIAKVENIDGRLLYRLEGALAGKLAATEHLSSDETGVFRHRFNGMEMTPPVQLLKNPIKLGDQWKSQTRVGQQDYPIGCAIGPISEQIETPAGRFETIKLSVTTKENDVDLLSEYWLASGVGVVKQVMTIGGRKIELTLRNHQPGQSSDDDGTP